MKTETLSYCWNRARKLLNDDETWTMDTHSQVDTNNVQVEIK